MVQVHIIDANGETRTLEGRDGQDLMSLAVNNDVAGIVGECGGDLSCGTCHVHVEREWMEAVGPAGADEHDMLEVVEDLQPNSRLCCQLTLSPALNGLTVRAAANS
ncbi:MAG: 2Fe-2S iron-sulfur cluster-binding protein [Candidatus Brevundimonas colombiensis]|uniref:2Fe-2S iron-sulfur cluster-binding protein n=1 Tax=Candidatus Brevundimonas colombiensis TaxID=3121376 RepID=A0AAJ5X3T6_9CAUL|nr:2Fe-2S iron-sulfur cluster-binding protein [Brevundimonas sp.]WEK41474.1 MAG: 2Fe-2S iron-sulfur cluster-binding protein [Brevundimonas sp.]